MVNVDSKPPANVLQHKCDARLEDDWVIFTCPKCADYERRLNYQTGTMQVKNSKENIFHSGQYYPHEIQHALKHKH